MVRVTSTLSSLGTYAFMKEMERVTFKEMTLTNQHRVRLVWAADFNSPGGWFDPNLDIAPYDVGSLADLPNNRAEIKVDGHYTITAHFTTEGPSPPGDYRVWVRVNGVDIGMYLSMYKTAAALCAPLIIGSVDLVVGDLITFRVFTVGVAMIYGQAFSQGLIIRRNF